MTARKNAEPDASEPQTEAVPEPLSEPLSERLIDELLPEEIDWRELVRTYPVPCLMAATAFGFVVGRKHGMAIAAALVSFAGQRASQAVEEVLQQHDLQHDLDSEPQA